MYLVPAGLHPAITNVSCAVQITGSPSTVSCSLPFLLQVAATAPVPAFVWVVHTSTGGAPQRLNTTVTLVPPPPLALSPGGSLGLSPLTAGGGRIVLRLSARRLTAADWSAAGLQPPPQATIDKAAVWMAGLPCTQTAWESSTTLSCAIPATDGVELPVVVLLAGLFNVSGVLSSVFTPPTLMASPTDVTLLPPVSSIVNITLTGASLCVNQRARFSTAYVGSLRCATVGCIAGRPNNALCVGWNVTAATAAGLLQSNSISTVLLNATAVWANRAAPLVACEACITLVTRPELVSVTPTSIATPGVPVVVTGNGFTDASRKPPTVFIGGEVCSGVVVLKTDVVQCTAPVMQPSVPGYPVVSVVVVNAAGAASTEPVTLTYPATFAVSWAPSSTTLTALPGGLLSPAPTLRVLSREAATCTLAINTTSCATSNPALASRPSGMTVSSPATSLSVGTSGSSDAVYTDLRLDALTVAGGSGCTGSLTASCIDSVGLAASTAGLPNPDVVLAGWRADWNATSVPQPFVVVPGELPTLAATFTILSGNGDASLDVAPTQVSCLALLLPASATPPPLNKSLDLVSPRDLLSSSTAVVAALNSTAAAVAFAGLSTSAVALGQALSVYAECTWTPTGERVRLPRLSLSTAQLALDWVHPPSTVLGYMALPLHLVVTTIVPATVAGGTSATAATAECEVVLVNATVRGTQVVADTWAISINGTPPAGTVVTTAVNVTLQAAQGAVAFVRVACSAWGQSLASPPLRLAVATLDLRRTSALPTYFIASDASSPWPVEPQLEVAVAVVDASGASAANATDVTCSLSTTTAGVELKVAGSSASSALLSIPAHPTNGTVVVPRFYVQTATTTPEVELMIECRRTLGDAPPSLHLTIPALRLTAQLCTQPARDSLVGTALPAFDVGIVATHPGGPSTTPCTDTIPPAFALPAIVCSITLEATNTSISDTSNIFLKHTVATMAVASHLVTFDAFTLVAPQGETYGLSLACAVGGLAITPTLAFTVTLEGCSVGQESQGVVCVTCSGTSFSLGGIGARCVACPLAGATCNEGILTLLPHYFRPAGQAGEPLGPTTELHPCYNAEACTLVYSGNISGGAAYGCSYGYTGPLCGVCDAAVNYARFGEACAVCWDAGASWLFLLVVVTLVLAVLTRVALRKDSSNSEASIVLRITLGYLQAVGSLRVFRAGSTKAYDSVMGWTEVVSASPLSVGALECILRLPYLFQYSATILLPLLASAAVVVIFLGVTTGRSVHCKPRCGMDVVAFRSAVASWWASKRHLSTLLFVLFLAYMPIVSASLRALDCIDPVAGTQDLRSDLRVECGVGQHAAARALAYTVLVVLGAGFPAGLAWLMGTARSEQLVDPALHATWGFLFDGYRAPTRALVSSTGSVGFSSRDVMGSLRKLLGAQPPPPVVVGKAAMGVGKLASAPPGTGTTSARGERRPSLLRSAAAEAPSHAWVVSGDSRVWWEAIVLCRKAGVVLLAVKVTNPYLQCVGATLWFAAAAVLQARYSPYTKRLFNGLEMASLVATFLTAVISTALLQYNVGVTSAELHPPEAMTGIEWAVTVLLGVINVGTFAVFAGLWLRLQCARAHRIARRASVVTALSGHVAGVRASLARRRSSAGVSVIAASVAPLGNSSAAANCSPGASDGDGTAPSSTVNPLRARAAAPGGSSSSVSEAAPPAAAANVAAMPRTTSIRRCVMNSEIASAAGGDEGVVIAADGAASSAAASSATACAASIAANVAAAPNHARVVAFAATPAARSRRR